MKTKEVQTFEDNTSYILYVLKKIVDYKTYDIKKPYTDNVEDYTTELIKAYKKNGKSILTTQEVEQLELSIKEVRKLLSCSRYTVYPAISVFLWREFLADIYNIYDLDSGLFMLGSENDKVNNLHDKLLFYSIYNPMSGVVLQKNTSRNLGELVDGVIEHAYPSIKELWGWC